MILQDSWREPTQTAAMYSLFLILAATSIIITTAMHLGVYTTEILY